MDTDKSYTAVFEQWFTLTTQVADPTWAGNISVELPEGAGPGPTYQFPANTLVRVRATRTGSRLDRWTLNSLNQGAEDYMEFVIQSDSTVVAYFVPTTTVSVGSQTLDAQGQIMPFGTGGSVWPTGGDVDCVGPNYLTLNFTATAFPDHRFLQWAGDVSGSANPVPLLINGPKTVRAQFIRTFWIDGYIAPANAGTMTCTLVTGHNNAGHYDDGSTVELSATPVEGMAFDHWEIEVPYSGNPPSTVEDNPTNVLMDTHKQVTAHFVDARTLTVVVEPAGAGTVTPGSGAFPVNSTQTLVADANQDWLFSYWAGDIEVGTDTDEDSIDITMDSDKQIIARFVQRPGIGDIDMLADFATFLTTIGATESIESFDMNECDYDENAERIYVGNGIPDAAELHLVETILNSPRLDLSIRSGVAQGVIWDSWLQNLQQATFDLENASLPPTADIAALARIIAGYATLGDFISLGAVEHLLQSVFPNFGLTGANYNNGGMPHLPYRKDADNYGKTNLMEWEALSGTAWPERIESYDQQALGLAPNETSNPAPLPNQVGSGPECIENEFVVTSANSVDHGFWTTWPPGNSFAETIPPSGEAPRGTDIFVAATADEGNGWFFSEWQAPTINGSRNTIDRFNLDDSSTAAALFERITLKVIKDTSLFSIQATPSGGAFEYGENEDWRIFTGPPGSSVTLKAISNDSRYPVFGGWSAGRLVGQEFTGIGNDENPVTIPLVPENYMTYVSDAFFRSVPQAGEFYHVRIRTSEGGTILGGRIKDSAWQDYTFAGSVFYHESDSVIFFAAPSPGYEFVDWTFPLNGNVNEYPYGPGRIWFTNAAQIEEVGAVFRRKEEYELDLQVNDIDNYPAGTIRSVYPIGKYLPKDSEVSVEATPHPGFIFVRWDGNARDLEGELVTNIYDNPVSIRMRDNYQIRAIFEQASVELYQDERQIFQSSLDTNSDGVPDDVATISVLPQMPNLDAIVPGLDASVTVWWNVEITFTPDHQAPQVFQAGTDMPGNQFFNITQELGANFYGGDAVVSCTFCDNYREFRFRILGINPAFETITTALQDDKYRALVWKESKFRQFRAPEEISAGGSIGLPLNNAYPAEHGDGGYGLGQITNERPTHDHLWNWTANVQESKSRFDARIAKATTYLTNLIATSGISHTLTPDEILLEAWYLYQQGINADIHYWGRVTVSGLVKDTPETDGHPHAEKCLEYWDHDNVEDQPWLNP